MSCRNETADSTRTLRVSQLRTCYMMPRASAGLVGERAVALAPAGPREAARTRPNTRPCSAAATSASLRGAVQVLRIGRFLIVGLDPLPDLGEHLAREQAAGDAAGDRQGLVQGFGRTHGHSSADPIPET